MKKGPATVTVRSGQLEFVKVNANRLDWHDIYHQMLTLSWPRFIGALLGAYLALNLIFATLYFVGAPCIAELPRGSFSGAFFFSVETLATVGYGHMYPATVYGHLVTTSEIMVGMFGTAVMTGLVFVRFSRPTSRVIFSHTLVITPFDGQPTLMVRVANLRHHAMVEAEFRMMFLRNEAIQEDPSFRRFYPLRLQVERVITFPAVTTMRHVIDELSPLYGATLESMERDDVRVVASVVAIDSISQAPLQSQQDYSWREIRTDHRFVEVYTEAGEGRLTVDYGRLHDTEPVPKAG